MYSHVGEVSNLAFAPTDPSLLLTVRTATAPGATAPRIGTTLWRLPELTETVNSERALDADSTAAPPREMVQLGELPTAAPSIRLMHAQWLPPADGGAGSSGSGSAAAGGGATDASVVTVDDTSVRLWRVRPSGATALVSAPTTYGMDDVSFIGGVACDALHPTEVAVATDASVTCWDTRTGERVRHIPHAVPAGACVRALSYNINKPWHLATGGDDYRVKVWDVRRPDAPVKVLDGHTHWYGARGRGG